MQIICTIFLIIRNETAFIRSAVPIKIVLNKRCVKQAEGVAHKQANGNQKLVHGYGNNELRRGKTDRKDAVKLANYGLDRWLTLPRYVPEEDKLKPLFH